MSTSFLQRQNSVIVEQIGIIAEVDENTSKSSFEEMDTKPRNDTMME